jgi:hypothetical protein
MAERTTSVRKTIVFSVVALVALVASTMPALAQEPVVIIPNCDVPGNAFCEILFEVSADEEIGLYWGWYAATKGLIRVYLGHTTQTLTLTDSQGAQFWGMTAEAVRAAYGPTQKWDSDEFFGGPTCPMPWVYVTETEWGLPLGELPPGEYTLTWRGSFDQPVNDAIHACKPERTYVPVPSLYRGVETFVKTITVTEP